MRLRFAGADFVAVVPAGDDRESRIARAIT